MELGDDEIHICRALAHDVHIVGVHYQKGVMYVRAVKPVCTFLLLGVLGGCAWRGGIAAQNLSDVPSSPGTLDSSILQMSEYEEARVTTSASTRPTVAIESLYEPGVPELAPYSTALWAAVAAAEEEPVELFSCFFVVLALVFRHAYGHDLVRLHTTPKVGRTYID